MADGAPPDLAALYRQTRTRLGELVGGLGPAELATAVPACPGWSVHDVLAHLTAVAEDVLEGRLTAPPDDEHTAGQVARFRGTPTGTVLERWAELAPQLEAMIDTFTVWPAVLDVGTHEQDIRTAVGLPGARHSDVVVLGAAQLLTWLRPPVPLRVVVEDETFHTGPDGEPGRGPDHEPLTVRSDRFEVFRWRLGRRSRRQLSAMDWSADPTPVLDHLVIFGPSPVDLVESERPGAPPATSAAVAAAALPTHPEDGDQLAEDERHGASVADPPLRLAADPGRRMTGPAASE